MKVRGANHLIVECKEGLPEMVSFFNLLHSLFAYCTPSDESLVRLFDGQEA